jgi:sialate O-acetylesterase
MLLRKTSFVVLVLVAFGFWNRLHASENANLPFVHPLFADHAVLQRDIRIPVWGWTKPGERVTVTLGKKTATAIADASGRWEAKIGPFKAGGPYTLKVNGPETVVVNDVLIGDVWICSGQSNMEMGIGACNATNDIAQADFPRIRLLTVPRLVTTKPVQTLECQWLPCNPTNVMKGQWAGFSAAGFFFGRELHQELKIPIGLIHTSWGGTIAEAWTSAEGLKPLGDFDGQLERIERINNSPKQSDYSKELEKWYEQNDPGTSGHWEKRDADASAWKSVTMPQAWEQAGLPNFDGIVWFQRQFDLPADWAGKDLTLSLGPIDDMDTTWVNGVKVGHQNLFFAPRSYNIPAGALKAGANVITIRVLDTGGDGGLIGKPEQMHVKPGKSSGATPISLAGEWQMRESNPLAKMPAVPREIDSNNPNVTTVLYNGMIAPLVPFGIKGAIWYQGESNAGRAAQYRRLLPAMIKDWRNHFEVGAFPFYIVQLAAFMSTAPEPGDNEWAELREAQALTAKKVPHSGLAVAIDIGDAKDIHPKDKLDVGRRLALSALANTYGKKIEYSGPWYKSMKVTDRGICLSFDHVGGGLVAKGEKLTGFAIAGEDQKFVWADAVIDGSNIFVSSPKVAKPVAVRYAWDANPVCNLYNKAGLPAVPFRTDDWPMMTANNK